MRFSRLLAVAVSAIAISVVMPTIAAAHPEGVSDMPELATGPSDPVLVHRALEQAGTIWLAADYQYPQEGCPDYYPRYGMDGKVSSRVPAFDSCATDRMSMFEHSNQCLVPYARRCLEQVMPTQSIPRGHGYSMYGVLYTFGQPEPARRIILERRILGLQSKFTPYANQLTATIGEIGSARFHDVAKSKYAYRWATRNDVGQVIRNTVPAVTIVQPTVKSVTVSRRTVRRSQPFVTTLTTDVPIWGNVRVEYQYGARWIQVSRSAIRGARKFSILGRINRASGRFRTRVTIESTSQEGRPWYDGVIQPTGVIRVNSTFTILR